MTSQDGAGSSPIWDLEPGDRIKRTILHKRFGGSGQGGIASSSTTPNVMIFTDPASGHGHGYHDRWEGTVLSYVGEGQTGDQQFVRGNRAIIEHGQHGRAIRTFKGARGEVQYLGEFETDPVEPFTWDLAPETGGGRLRKVIRFRLVPKRVGSLAKAVSARVYRRADEAPQTAQSDPFARDPNEMDRALAAHAKTQNALHAFLKRHNCSAWSPAADEPDFDLAWRKSKVLWVGEIKSLAFGNEVRQLRLGLGQVLHYQDLLLVTEREVRAALVLPNAPQDRRWVDLCLRHGVVLVWPETFAELLR